MNTFLKKIQNFIKYKAINFYLFFLLFLIVLVFPVILNPKFLINISGLEWLKKLYSIEIKEEWLGYLGNVMAGILPLGIIFYNEKEAKRQQEQFKEERRLQQEQFNKQLELQEKYKKQEFYIMKFDKEKEIAQKALIEWDKSIFDDFLELILKLYSDLLNNLDEVKTLKVTQIDEIVQKLSVTRGKIVNKCNITMTTVALLEWRVVEKDLKQSHNLNLNGTIFTTFYLSKKQCYQAFEDLHKKINIILELLSDEAKDIERMYRISQNLSSDEIKIKITNFKEVCITQFKEYDDLFNSASNTLVSYFYNINKCLVNYEFSHFELKNPQ